MKEPIDTVQTAFHIYPSHLEFLEKINSNRSLALRTVLDSIQNSEDLNKRKENLDHIITFTSFGLICWMLSYIFTDFIITAVSIFLGVFLFAYGIVGGVINALQRTKYKNRNNRRTI